MAPGKVAMSAIGQPAPESGQGGTEGQSAFDFERGYNELRPEFTRATQELSSTRERLSEFEQLFEALHDSDPEIQQAALAALGLEVDTGSQGGNSQEEFVDPLEAQLNAANERLARLESAREQEASERESQQLTQLRDEFIGESIGQIEDELKQTHGPSFKFTVKEEEALGNLAIAMENAEGVPDVQAAYQLLYGNEGVLETNRGRWIATKTGAAQPPLGTSIPADKKPQNKAERIAYMDERVRALDQQQ